MGAVGGDDSATGDSAAGGEMTWEADPRLATRGGEANRDAFGADADEGRGNDGRGSLAAALLEESVAVALDAVALDSAEGERRLITRGMLAGRVGGGPSGR